MPFKIQLILLCFFLVIQSRADVLYIDMNNTKEEIEIFRKYARDVLHENITILPDENMREEYNRRGLAIVKIKEKIEKETTNPLIQEFKCKEVSWKEITCPQVNKNLDRFNQLMDLRKKLWQEHDDMPSRYHLANLESDLKKQKDCQYSTVVLSGHHNQIQWRGDTAWIPEEGLHDTLKQLPCRDSVKNVFQLGCKTFDIKKIKEEWSETFPKATYIGAYIDKGYRHDSAVGNAYLEKILLMHQTTLAIDKAESLDASKSKVIPYTPPGWGVCLIQPNQHFQYYLPKKSGN